ncbi:MAG TPA: hypothetical protein VM683_15750 [Anaeromyxobacteraceae bacterium]|nr:hypothetical protein [Anaeromyxobacteraceae bacterium]
MILLVVALVFADASPAPAPEAAKAPFICPAGTELQGALPPDGFEVWCERTTELPERRREGPWRSYYDDGGLAKAGSFRAGKLDGPFTVWHRNGKPAQSGAYSEGEREGSWTIWFESGRVEERCGYERGEKHGPFATFWPGGGRKVDGRHCRGLQCGRWTSWDEAGRELGSVVYEEIRSAP